MFTLYLNLHLCLQSINFQSSTIYNHKQSITILNKYVGGDSSRDISPKNENDVIKLLTLMLFQTCKTSVRAFWPPIDSNKTDTFKAKKGSLGHH